MLTAELHHIALDHVAMMCVRRESGGWRVILERLCGTHGKMARDREGELHDQNVISIARGLLLV